IEPVRGRHETPVWRVGRRQPGAEFAGPAVPLAPRGHVPDAQPGAGPPGDERLAVRREGEVPGTSTQAMEHPPGGAIDQAAVVRAAAGEGLAVRSEVKGGEKSVPAKRELAQLLAAYQVEETE